MSIVLLFLPCNLTIVFMKSVTFSVKNVDNNYVHFERNVDCADGISIPFESIVSSLMYLYQGLKVYVDIKVSSF